MTATRAPAPIPVSSSADATRGILLMVAFSLIIVTADATAKFLTHSIPIIEIVWARNVFTVFLALALVRGRGRGMRQLFASRSPGLQIARSTLQFASAVMFFTGLRYIPLADATAISFASPLLIVALSAPMLGEKVGIRRWAAVIVGFIGMLVIMRPGVGEAHWAMVLMLGMVVTSALYQILTRFVAARDDAVTTLLFTPLVGTAASTMLLPWNWAMPDATGWLLMALLGTLGGFAHFLLIKSYSLAEAGLVAPFKYTQIIWSIGYGFLIFAELPDGFTLAGAAIIAGSGLYTLYRESVRRRSIR